MPGADVAKALICSEARAFGILYVGPVLWLAADAGHYFYWVASALGFAAWIVLLAGRSRAKTALACAISSLTTLGNLPLAISLYIQRSGFNERFFHHLDASSVAVAWNTYRLEVLLAGLYWVIVTVVPLLVARAPEQEAGTRASPDPLAGRRGRPGRLRPGHLACCLRPSPTASAQRAGDRHPESRPRRGGDAERFTPQSRSHRRRKPGGDLRQRRAHGRGSYTRPLHARAGRGALRQHHPARECVMDDGRHRRIAVLGAASPARAVGRHKGCRGLAVQPAEHPHRCN